MGVGDLYVKGVITKEDLGFVWICCDIRDVSQNCLQWGRSNLGDPAESPKIRLLNRDFGNILSIFSQEKNSKTQSSLNFL